MVGPRWAVRATALLFLAAVGCAPRPQAPALESGPVYENAKEGVRFIVPEGWVQFARTDTPPGRLDKPLLLVSYQVPSGNRQVELELYAADLEAATELAAYLAEHRIGPAKWDPKPPPQSLHVGGAQATRFRFARQAGKTAFVREVVVVRRGGRAYFFAFAAPASDDASQDQWRQVLASVRWTK